MLTRHVSMAVSFLLLALTEAAPAAGQGPVSARQRLAQENRTLLPTAGVPSIRIRRIGAIALHPPQDMVIPRPLVLDADRAWAGEDVELDVWGLPAKNAGIWVLVKGRNAAGWHAYGPAHAGDDGLWIVHEVRFGERSQQGRYFVVRAAILEEAPSGPAGPITDWQASAMALSAPQPITVERRVVEPWEPQTRPQIRISTIDHQTVAEAEPMLVKANVSAAGTLSFPAGIDKNAGGRALAYVVVHPASTERWRIFGPAEVEDGAWQLREITIADAGEPHWLRYQLFAILAREPLAPGEVSYERWLASAVTASGSIQLTVKPREPILPSPYITSVDITELVTLKETLPVERSENGEIDAMLLPSLELVTEVRGSLDHLPHGASVWLLLNPIGTPIWEVHGQALVTPSNWRQPLMHSGRLRGLGSGSFRLLAMISTASLPPGLVDYSTWRRTAIATSETILVVENERENPELHHPTLTIRRIADVAVGNPHTEAAILENPSISGEIQGLPSGAAVWVGTRLVDAESWLFTGPALINRDTWKLPHVRFFDTSGEHPHTSAFDVIAVVAQGNLPPTLLSLGQLRWYTLAVSSVMRVYDRPSDQITFLRIPAMTLWILIALVVLLLVLEYSLAVISSVLERLIEVLDQLVVYLKRELQGIPKPQMVPSTLGVLILGLEVYAIVSYLPIYTHVLETVLELSPEKSFSLALLLIIFIGLAGIFIHISIEYLGIRDPESKRRKWTVGKLISVLGISVITVCLWGVQTLLYLKLYLAQVDSGDTIVPIAMALAAFFIAGIETLGFYWATRLGFDFIVWLLVHLLAFGPPLIIARLLEVVAIFFRRLPSRQRRVVDTEAVS